MKAKTSRQLKRKEGRDAEWYQPLFHKVLQIFGITFQPNGSNVPDRHKQFECYAKPAKRR